VQELQSPEGRTLLPATHVAEVGVLIIQPKKAPSARVYLHYVRETPPVSSIDQNLAELANDPTLPRTSEPDLCPACKNDEAVFFQSPVRRPQDPLTLFFICTRCRHRWTDH
jgi:DNA-directed RNA polymerase subunit M/transcription elongation factor TFIIS